MQHTNLIKDWVEALSSNNYKQGSIYLRSYDDRFCVMGVLGDILVQRGYGAWDYVCSCYAYAPLNGRASSPYVLRDSWFQDPLIHYIIRDEANLIGLNDSGTAFKDLAIRIMDSYEEYKQRT